MSIVQVSTVTDKKLIKTMLFSRYGDLREQRLVRQGRGLFHVSSMGHESMAAVALHLTPGDYCFPCYRDRAFVLERGLTTYELALDFFGKRESSSGGRQLPGHFSRRALNIWSFPSPVGSHLLPACGVALGMQMDGLPQVVVATVGEGASRQGDFFEAVCFAKEKKLPILFIVEDNGIAISTRTKGKTPLDLGMLPVEEWQCIDGCRVKEVKRASEEAIERLREGRGPAFLWCRTERLGNHTSVDDHRNYRSEREIEALQKRDPLLLYKKQLVEEEVFSEEEISELEREIEAKVNSDYELAYAAEEPKASEVTLHMWGELPKSVIAPLETGREYRMADAVNRTFQGALESDQRYYFFGEDVEDPLGGAFRLTKGLSSAFPGRVNNAPLAESTILGVACGLASYGKRPVFELQFIDFIAPAWNQLVTNLSSLRWRSFGEWNCPVVIYAPYGAYLPGGSLWHSQSNEAALAHFPGIYIVVPSTAADAAGLLWTAMHAEDPVIVLLPKHLLWVPQEISGPLESVPLGRAAIRQEGTDLTVVTWGNCVEVVFEALKKCESLSVEVIDLRSIVPWDRETILQSLHKTGRLLVVQEDNRCCSVGQMIISTLLEENSSWNKWKSPPALISRDDVHIGYNPNYEYAALPDAVRVVKMMESMCEKIPTVVQRVEKKSIMEPKAIHMPNIGEGIREARILRLLKQEGDEVKCDDPLCEVESDKAVFEVEASFGGILSNWHVKEKQSVPVGGTLVTIVPDESMGYEPVVPGAPPELPEEVVSGQNSYALYKGGLPLEVVKQIKVVLPAAITLRANWESIHSVRTTELCKVDGQFPARTAMVAWCIVQAMKRHPAFCRVSRAEDVVGPMEDFDFGVAVALKHDALETAVISQANTLDWTTFNRVYREAIAAAKRGDSSGKSGIPLILTSMSALKIHSAVPVVVPPAIATLFLGGAHYVATRSSKGPVFEEVVTLSLSFDHRWINGAGAARFLNSVKKYIEQFAVPVEEK